MSLKEPVKGCPICGSVEIHIIGQPIQNNLRVSLQEDFRIVQCNNCELYFVDPYINFSEEEWKLLYDSGYFEERPQLYFRRRNNDVIKRFNNLLKILGRDDDINYLDIGCGQGFSLIEGKKRGWNVYGIDIYDNRLEEAKSKDIVFYSDDITSASLKNDFYDIIFLDSVLEHVLNPMEYLLRIKELLKPGGVVYIGIPNEDCFLNTVKKFVNISIGKRSKSSKLKPFISPYHVVGFNNASIKNAIDKSGLEIGLFRNFARKFEFLNNKINTRAFWIDLALLPVELISWILRKEVYFEMILKKNTSQL